MTQATSSVPPTRNEHPLRFSGYQQRNRPGPDLS